MTDTLSDVLRSVQLASALFFSIDASARSGADANPDIADLRAAMPGVEHVIACHVVTEGACWSGMRGAPSVRLETGDVLILPHGDAPISIQPGDHEAQVVCALLGCNARPFSPLLATLPRVMHLRGASQPDSVRLRLVELALAESAGNKAGRECLLARLGELLLFEVVRQYLAALPPENVGWFAGLCDPGIGRALQQLHERPAHPWSLEELAKEARMSRSTLAERFTYLVGTPPIQYLAQWRIQLAISMLRGSKSSLAEIADRVGYGSEAAFSRAFKRRLGVSPAPYRREPVWRNAS